MPTYATIGLAAPFLLLFARLLQGLSVGGEYGTSATYMSEVAFHGHRGFFASFQYVTLIGGQLLAVLVLVIIQQFLSDAELKAWGWRIPFAIGALNVRVISPPSPRETMLNVFPSAGPSAWVGSFQDWRRDSTNPVVR